MKPYLTVSSILVLAIAGAAGTYLPLYADSNTAAQPTLVPPARSQTEVQSKVAAAVQSRVANITDNAASRNGYGALVGSFDKKTRDRLGLEQTANLDQLNARIDQFRKDFKDKYNEDFNLKPATLAGLPVYRGADDDHATIQLASLPALNAKADVRLDKDQGARPASSMAGQISLINEHTLMSNGWRIMIPENISGQQLRDALGSKLASISNDKTAWPSNVHDAYGAMAGQILQTLTQPGSVNVTVDNR